MVSGTVRDGPYASGPKPASENTMTNTPPTDDFSIDIDDLPCPACDSPYATGATLLAPGLTVATILAPDEVQNATGATFAGTTTGAAGGAAVGSIAGPAGTVIGGALGALVGGSITKERQEKRRVVLDCSECSYHGDALGTETDNR